MAELFIFAVFALLVSIPTAVVESLAARAERRAPVLDVTPPDPARCPAPRRHAGTVRTPRRAVPSGR